MAYNNTKKKRSRGGRKTSSQRSYAAGFNKAAKLAHQGKLRAARGKR